jgi:membrane-associated protease RseP (regulator of RpoE activity)
VLGVDVSDVPASYPRRYQTAGAYVTRIAPNSPAETARMLPGDIIVKIHGTSVTDHGSFRAAAASLGAAASVPVEVRRYGRALTLNVTPVPGDTLFPQTPSCEPQLVTTELGAASVSARRRDFENERVHGARAITNSPATLAYLPQ